MSDAQLPEDPGSLWRQQPQEETQVLPSRFLDRRTQALSATTRSEIVSSLSAGILFVAILAWRFELRSDPYVIGGALLVLCWVLITLYRFRNRIWPGKKAEEAPFSAPALEFYRAELKRRREHLSTGWVWSGPLLLACVTLVLILVRNGMPSTRRIYSILPLLLLLVAWAAYGLWRRRRLAAEIQNEINEISALSS